jgi:hypothetical protein
MDNNYIVKLIAVIASLLLLVATEPFYREVLFNASIPLIVEFQSTATPASIEFFKAVSDMGAFGLTLIVVVGSYVWIERERCFYYMTFFTGMIFVSNLTKMMYHSPRPYMVSDSV